MLVKHLCCSGGKLTNSIPVHNSWPSKLLPTTPTTPAFCFPGFHNLSEPCWLRIHHLHDRIHQNCCVFIKLAGWDLQIGSCWRDFFCPPSPLQQQTASCLRPLVSFSSLFAYLTFFKQLSLTLALQSFWPFHHVWTVRTCKSLLPKSTNMHSCASVLDGFFPDRHKSPSGRCGSVERVRVWFGGGSCLQSWQLDGPLPTSLQL